MNDSNKQALRGAVVGAGYFSQFHFDAWNRIDDVQLVAVCDVDQDKANEAAAAHNIEKTYTDFTAMLDAENLDFVDIITRPDSHLPLVQSAANAAVPVICQKPLAPTYQDSQQIVRIARKANIPLMIHENFRFQPWYRETKRLLETGAIGDRLHSISFRSRTGDGWQPDAYMGRQPYFRTMERFLVFEMGVHFIDTFRYLGGEVSGVFADLRKLNSDIAGEDAGTVLFEFASGARGIWDANRYNETLATNPRYTFGAMLVEGNGGSIHLAHDGSVTLHPLGEEPRAHTYDHTDRNFASDCVLATQQHFVDCLRNSTPFETSGEQYLKTLAVQEAIYESAEKRQPIRDFVAGEV